MFNFFLPYSLLWNEFKNVTYKQASYKEQNECAIHTLAKRYYELIHTHAKGDNCMHDCSVLYILTIYS